VSEHARDTVDLSDLGRDQANDLLVQLGFVGRLIIRDQFDGVKDNQKLVLDLIERGGGRTHSTPPRRSCRSANSAVVTGCGSARPIGLRFP
jgi:hypothetical protein